MNRPILTYNGNPDHNTAFLSAETQNAIYDACEHLERHGVEFFYAIKNGKYSNGDFIYIYNGKKKTLSWQPSAQSEKSFLNEVRSALFCMVAEIDDEKANLNKYVVTVTETYKKSVVVYAESPEQAEMYITRKYSHGGLKFDSADDFEEYNVFDNTGAFAGDDMKPVVDGLPTYTAAPHLYEVHKIEDEFTGTPATVNTYEDYAEAVKLYNDIDKEGKPARLLKVDYDGDPIDEVKSNYD